MNRFFSTLNISTLNQICQCALMYPGFNKAYDTCHDHDRAKYFHRLTSLWLQPQPNTQWVSCEVTEN